MNENIVILEVYHGLYTHFLLTDTLHTGQFKARGESVNQHEDSNSIGRITRIESVQSES